MNFDENMLYIIGKLFLKVLRYFPHIFKTDLIWERYERPKLWDNKSLNFGTPTWES
jgi:hypothetical protein